MEVGISLCGVFCRKFGGGYAIMNTSSGRPARRYPKRKWCPTRHFPPEHIPFGRVPQVPDYERRQDGSVLWRIPVGETPFHFLADDVRKERTGVHSRVRLLLGTAILAYDTFNVGRSEERGRLASTAHKLLSDVIAESYPLNVLRHDLDLFCDGLWDAYNGRYRAGYTTGDDEPSKPDFILEPYVIREGGTILFGPPEQGKSWTAMLMAQTLEHSGAKTFWVAGQMAGRPLFVNLERSESSWRRRLARVNLALDLDSSSGMQTIHARGASLSDVASEIRRLLRDKEAQIDCIFLDSLSRAGYGDLNDNQTANRIIDVLNGFGIAWLALAHSPRGDSTHAYGSVMQDAGADVILKQSAERKEDGTLLVALEMTKGNDVPRAKRQLLAYEFHADYGLTTIRGARPTEFNELDTDRKPKMHDAIVTYLQHHGGSGTGSEIAKELGFNQTNVASHLANNEAFIRLPRQGASQPYGLRDVLP